MSSGSHTNGTRSFFWGWWCSSSLSAHKLYKLQGGKDDFLHFLLDLCTHLFINAPRLERPMKRTAVDIIARLTGRNHWPAKRETPAEWKDAKSRVKKCRVCTARGKKTKGGKEIKTKLDLQGLSWWTRLVCGQGMFWALSYQVWLQSVDKMMFHKCK